MWPIILAAVILFIFIISEIHRLAKESENTLRRTVISCPNCEKTVSRRQVINMKNCVYCMPAPKPKTIKRVVKVAIIKQED